MPDLILAIINRFPLDGYRTYFICLLLAIMWSIYGVATGDYMSAISVILGSFAIIFKRKAITDVGDKQKEIKEMLEDITKKLQESTK